MSGQLSIFDLIPESNLEFHHHYHVSLICPKLNIAPFVTSSKEAAINEFAKLIYLLTDTTGNKIALYTDRKITTSDGSTVRWYECDKDCFVL